LQPPLWRDLLSDGKNKAFQLSIALEMAPQPAWVKNASG